MALKFNLALSLPHLNFSSSRATNPSSSLYLNRSFPSTNPLIAPRVRYIPAVRCRSSNPQAILDLKDGNGSHELLEQIGINGVPAVSISYDCMSICKHLFFPTVEKVYLFKGVTRDTLLQLVAKMKAEYLPPKEDVIMQNEALDDVYIIVSGKVEIIDCEIENENVIGTLHCGDMFGEVGALCCRPQGLKAKQEDNIAILRNFLKHHKKIKDLNIEELLAEGGGEEDGDQNMAFNLMTVAGTGNAAFLEELLRARLDPDNGDSKGRTPLVSFSPNLTAN